jgi:hypothetical protein
LDFPLLISDSRSPRNFISPGRPRRLKAIHPIPIPDVIASAIAFSDSQPQTKKLPRAKFLFSVLIQPNHGFSMQMLLFIS